MNSLYEDDEDGDLFALFVLEEVPISVSTSHLLSRMHRSQAWMQMINEVLQRNYEHADDWYFCLADDYDNIPDLGGDWVAGTYQPIDEDWYSPGVGATIEEVKEYIQSVPKPPKPLSKVHFAILDRDRYERHDQILICKVPAATSPSAAAEPPMSWLIAAAITMYSMEKALPGDKKFLGPQFPRNILVLADERVIRADDADEIVERLREMVKQHSKPGEMWHSETDEIGVLIDLTGRDALGPMAWELLCADAVKFQLPSMLNVRSEELELHSLRSGLVQLVGDGTLNADELVVGSSYAGLQSST
ncbi:hypothetical protein CLAFUW4_12746 [Fulvia fulva]|uniref:Uncharacterized protein n=1 Tax=Passalora fulva TaxID=5499 RepID=A0A9Q8UUT9_PASFU|nr:uncharacterized protein CLAFUR5_12612 [Fulvia fulva]KAK4612182.1 hypothetical protein CLAFUR4_12750 [Fulvia fulva]KAK4612381.1 hypothetical protein CLAFUR0_12757 [Fulvia fulva]UJO23291.1 hypothetical protein CLAFUR5_12612 [Fulvia fulva]WPV20896.1 hypothetical protein CLAFUW4_12746 [Fulvia fulva]WPV36615.1 hypothetical protein CLAFUW7_12753 [Fulvia fulva]